MRISALRRNVENELYWALLLTGLRQMQERGATSAFLETQAPNLFAQHLFASVDFTPLSTWQWYTKTVKPA